MTTFAIFIVLLITIGVLALTMRLSLLLTQRAICKVISVFRTRNAVDTTSAIFLREVGLTDKPAILKFGLRDYKPYVIQALIKKEVLRRTLDNKIYLSENNAIEFEKRSKIRCSG
jgi:hypothetical protein